MFIGVHKRGISMKCIIADDEMLIRKDIHRTATKVFGEETEFLLAENTDEVLEILKKESVQIALLDIDMPFFGGLELAKKIREIAPKTNIIFCTGYERYAPEVFELYVSDFIVKPVNEDRLRKAFQNLRFPIPKLSVKCFGRFEVTVEGNPVIFKRSQCKEVMAYLIDKRGGEVTEDEFRYLLWSEEEDTDKKRRYVRNIISEIRVALKDRGIENVVINNGNTGYRINRTQIDCDYYDYLDGKRTFSQSELESYMEQYEWAEAKRAFFEQAE